MTAAVPAGPAEHRRVHDRVQVDHVGSRLARTMRPSPRPCSCARRGLGRGEPGTDRARLRPRGPPPSSTPWPSASWRLDDGEQVLVRASTLAEPVAHVQDAHPAHDAMPAWPGIRPIIAAWRTRPGPKRRGDRRGAAPLGVADLAAAARVLRARRARGLEAARRCPSTSRATRSPRAPMRARWPASCATWSRRSASTARRLSTWSSWRRARDSSRACSCGGWTSCRRRCPAWPDSTCGT